MIPMLYEPFQHWAQGGSVFILSDLHFDDPFCRKMDAAWPESDEQVRRINQLVGGTDTFVCLGDVGNPAYVKKIHGRRKVLLLGNHDRRADYKGLFDEIYAGPLFIAEKILLSHEPVHGLNWCVNIHGHDHADSEPYRSSPFHLNLAANVCGYVPINLGRRIKEGLVADIDSIHRVTIDRAIERIDKEKSKRRDEKADDVRL